MIRTFFDSGVLIAAARSLDPDAVAAAHLSGADEFITTEKPNKAIHRSSLVKVVYLFR
jgi:hypothetical protein